MQCLAIRLIKGFRQLQFEVRLRRLALHVLKNHRRLHNHIQCASRELDLDASLLFLASEARPCKALVDAYEECRPS